MDYDNKKVLISAIYRSPNQNKNEFNLFLANLEQLLGEINKRKPYLSIIKVTLMQDLPRGGLKTLILRRA